MSKGVEIPRPFPRLTYAEAMDRYGTDKPDTRYGMELVDVSDLVKDSGFKVFSGAIKAGGIVKVLPIPGGNDQISNVRIKPGGDLFKVAASAGAKGWPTFVCGPTRRIDTIGAIKDNLSQTSLRIAEPHRGRRGNPAAVWGWPVDIVNATLDRVRQTMAKEMELIPCQSSICCGSPTSPCLSGMPTKNAWRPCTTPLRLPTQMILMT
jgi:aspartyl-tRNA synthetase